MSMALQRRYAVSHGMRRCVDVRGRCGTCLAQALLVSTARMIDIASTLPGAQVRERAVITPTASPSHIF